MSLFCMWLLRRGVVSDAQLETAKHTQALFQIPLGRLAMRERLLTQQQVEEILQQQGRGDERFGDIAVRLEFLTPTQVHLLLTKQNEIRPDLSALLVKTGALDVAKLEKEMAAYRDFYGADDSAEHDDDPPGMPNLTQS